MIVAGGRGKNACSTILSTSTFRWFTKNHVVCAKSSRASCRANLDGSPVFKRSQTPVFGQRIPPEQVQSIKTRPCRESSARTGWYDRLLEPNGTIKVAQQKACLELLGAEHGFRDQRKVDRRNKMVEQRVGPGGTFCWFDRNCHKFTTTTALVIPGPSALVERPTR